MNIDKFGRINSSKSSDSQSIDAISKLENMIMLLKNDFLDVTATVNAIGDLVKRLLLQMSIKDTQQQETDIRHSTIDLLTSKNGEPAIRLQV